MIAIFLQFLVRVYKRMFSASLLSTCRFTPTCSDYAMEALERHGAFYGGLLTLWRGLRCNPLSRCGLDLVPTKLHTHDIRTQTCQVNGVRKMTIAGERAVSAVATESCN